MTTQEVTQVETAVNIEAVTNGSTVKTEDATLKVVETSAPVVPKLDADSVKDATDAPMDANDSSGKHDSATPTVDAKVEAEKESKEDIKGMESTPVANGNSVSNREEVAEENATPSESDGVTILPHWHARPCVHITGLGGVVTEEDLLPFLTPHGRIGSFVFETDRKESAIVRYEPLGADGDNVITKVRETICSKEIKGKTLQVEPFRPDSLLFIGNLTPKIDDDGLRQMFETHGTVERAFVLRNATGRSKGYGFVEYALKSQASAAKVAMGNINMDGRVLRVEWSDCRKISDMFSTVLFVDRIAKDSAHIEQSLRNVFGQFGKVRDCHLAIGINNQLRGFAFIDFYHSTCADKAHEALDGKEVEGTNIRVSFANPSKSAQSYKPRFVNQPSVQPAINHSRGTYPEHMMRPVGPVMLGASVRGHTGIRVLGNRYMAHGRSNMLGMSLGMQFGRGAPVGPGMIGRNLVSPLMGTGAGMLGPGSVAASMIGRGPGLMLGHAGQRGVVAGNYGQHGHGLRVPSGRGPIPINSATIAQVATAQAKAREEEAKARAEAQAKQSQAGAKQSAAEQERLEQFRKMAAQQAQLAPQHNYYQQQPQSTVLDQPYKQSGLQYQYQQPYQQTTQQAPSHTQYQHQPAVQQAPTTQQPQQSYNSQYYSQSTLQYPQQTQQQQQPTQAQLQPAPSSQSQQQSTEQYSQQQQVYYQQPSQAAAQGTVATQQQYTQYAQQYGQQYGQQPQQQYGQQQTVPAYPDSTHQAPAQYTQQDYGNYYAQQQQSQTQQGQSLTAPVATTSTPASVIQTPDASQQQQAYAAYYQQRAQEAVAQAGTTAVQTTAASGSQTSLEAQWAAYYAAQAAQQQATATTAAYDQQQPAYGQQQTYVATAGAGYYQSAAVEGGQKRGADQLDYPTQAQVSYVYQQQPSTAATGFSQQPAVNGTAAYQQLPVAATGSYQQPASVASAYQQPAAAASTYQQPAAASTYQQPAAAASTYQQTVAGASTYQLPAAAASTYQQQPAAVAGTYQQPASVTNTYQQPASTANTYQQQTPAAYAQQQPGSSSVYGQAIAGAYQQAAPAQAGYQQSAAPAVAGYQQPAAAGSSYGQPSQTAIPTPVYDYSKRPRY